MIIVGLPLVGAPPNPILLDSSLARPDRPRRSQHSREPSRQDPLRGALCDRDAGARAMRKESERGLRPTPRRAGACLLVRSYVVWDG